MATEDGQLAYPIVDGIPVLLAPEQLRDADGWHADLTARQYAEAYEEMEFYNSVAESGTNELREGRLENLTGSSEVLKSIVRVADLEPSLRSFPDPREIWIDAPYDSEAEVDVYGHLSPIEGVDVMQIGGKGEHAVKLLLGGARRAVAVSPMVGELQYAIALAESFGVDDRLICVAAVAEELPFPDETFDRVLAGSCVHHMVTELALPECARVLSPGGKFGAVEPWRSPGYGLGTRIFGKREVEVYCRPLTAERVAPLEQCFGETTIVHHGALTRYPLVAFEKIGFRVSPETARRIQRTDDSISSRVPGLRSMGSSVALLGAKSR